MRTLLFLCTANYYRSRFAEYVFNALASSGGMEWRAVSRGLALERGTANEGTVSEFVVHRLRELGISVDASRHPYPAVADDFSRAQRVIALKEAEHRPLIHERHPQWADLVEYWQVHDYDPSSAFDPLAKIESAVGALIVELS